MAPRTALLAFLGVVLLLGFIRPISSTDTWSHLRTGQDIVRTASVPERDTYSFTAPGAEYVDQEWLGQVLLYLDWRAFGLSGVSVGAALLVAATLVLLLVRMKGGMAVDLSILVLLLPLADAHFFPRPHLLGWLCIVLLHRCLQGSPWKALALLAVWANLHASFALGAGLAVLHFLEKRKILWAAASILAPLLNPRGIHLYGFFLGLRDVPVGRLGEFQPFGWGSLGLVAWAAFSALLVAGLVRARYASAWDWLRAILLISLGFSARRFGIVAGLCLAPMLSRLWSPWIPRLRGSVILLCALLLGGLLHAVAGGKAPRLGVDAHALPVAATAFLERHAVPGPLFNDYNFGGWLLWNAPSRKVFVDGRMDVYRGEPIRDCFAISLAVPGWEARVARWSIRCFLVRPERPIARILLSHPGWDLAYFDSNSVIFVPRGSAPRALTNASPWGPRVPADLKGLEADLRSLIAENPGHFDAHGNLAQVLSLKGDREGARREAGLYLALCPPGAARPELGRLAGALP